MKILPLLKINPQVEQNLYKFSQIAAFYLDQTGDINFDSKNTILNRKTGAEGFEPPNDCTKTST
jgi:hypothetical protein